MIPCHTYPTLNWQSLRNLLPQRWDAGRRACSLRHIDVAVTHHIQKQEDILWNCGKYQVRNTSKLFSNHQQNEAKEYFQFGTNVIFSPTKREIRKEIQVHFPPPSILLELRFEKWRVQLKKNTFASRKEAYVEWQEIWNEKFGHAAAETRLHQVIHIQSYEWCAVPLFSYAAVCMMADFLKSYWLIGPPKKIFAYTKLEILFLY
jgi:hypothetical protein